MLSFFLITSDGITRPILLGKTFPFILTLRGEFVIRGITVFQHQRLSVDTCLFTTYSLQRFNIYIISNLFRKVKIDLHSYIGNGSSLALKHAAISLIASRIFKKVKIDLFEDSL
jgi:hypothetical protein